MSDLSPNVDGLIPDVLGESFEIMNSFQWTGYGDFLRTYCDALSWLTHSCPEDGSDENDIHEWWRLVENLAYLAGTAIALVDWDEGTRLAGNLNKHLERGFALDQSDGGLPAIWWNELDRKGHELAQAAKTAFPDDYVDVED